MRVLVILTCLVLSSSAFAECGTNLRGGTACSNGQTAGGYGPNTGNAWKAQKNQAGVTTTQTSKGGVVKTANGAYKSPGGVSCHKGANSHGCN
jgi:hypothetical protein